MTNLEFAAKLRELAEVYEKHPDAKQSVSQLMIICHDREALRATVKAFGTGTKSKDRDGDIRFVPHRFAELVAIFGMSKGICDRVAVGTRILPATREQIIPGQPEREETIYETRCPESLLEASA